MGEQTYFISVQADPEKGVTVDRNVPTNEDSISFYCTLPYKTFHDAFWGHSTIKALVLGGECSIKGWRLRSAYNFAISFDMSSTNWVQYYKSGLSIKQMKTERMRSFDCRSIGAKLP